MKNKLLKWIAIGILFVISGYAGVISEQPAPAQALEWAQIAAGGQHTVALKTDGSLWYWGTVLTPSLDKNSGYTLHPSPIQLLGGNNWKSVACGELHTVAIKTDGSLWAWGDNKDGQLGLGDTITRGLPNRVGKDIDWVFVACGGNHTVAIKKDGTLWFWGWSFSAQSSIPKKLGNDNNWKFADCGGAFSVALKTDGSLWTWGDNQFGQLGLGDHGHDERGFSSKADRSLPTRVGSNNWKFVACGDSHTLAIKKDGSLWSWGENEDDKLGLNIEKKCSVPQKDPGIESYCGKCDLCISWLCITVPTCVGNDNDWESAAGGNIHSIAIKNNGTLCSWGANYWGQLGTGNMNSISSPTTGIGAGWKIIDCGFGYGRTMAIRDDGTLWAWGDNRYGQLGLGDTKQRDTPTQVK
ncbi:MAG: hypothetical protein V1701_07705 [Planctomycetota bacterium]